MKKIYIIDEHQSSKFNGIGTYIEELIYCFRKLNMETCLISFNSDTAEFDIMEKEDGTKVMSFPPLSDNFSNCYAIVDKFFRLYIEDSLENVFFVNHFPCEIFLKNIRNSFPLSKFLLVVHNQLWTSELLGDSIKLQEIICEKKNEDIKDKYKFLIHNFRIEQRTYDAADCVICLSGDTYKTIKDIYKKTQNVFLIKHGYQDRAQYPVSEQQKQKNRARMNIPADEKVLIYVGRLSAAKGIDVFIKSFCKIAKENPQARLVIAGTPLNKEYYSYLFRISQKAVCQISFLGQVSRSEIRDWYTVADIGIFPSYTEQCSFTGIEMMMYGLPIIASNGFGVKNMFTDNVNAKIAEIGNDKEEYGKNLTNAIQYLLNSEAVCKVLGTNARRTFEIKYNIENMLKEYHRLLNLL